MCIHNKVQIQTIANLQRATTQYGCDRICMIEPLFALVGKKIQSSYYPSTM